MDQALKPIHEAFQPLRPGLFSILIGTFIASMLFGLSTHQTYRYFRFYQFDDRKWLKLFVIVFWVFDVMHIIACICTSYSYVILCHTNVSGLDIMGWPPAVIIIITSTVEVMTNGFYIWRLHILRNKKDTLLIVLVVLLLTHCGIIFTSCAKTIMSLQYSNLHKITWLVSLGFLLNAVLDIAVTGSLVLCLRENRTGINRTDSMLNVLVWYTIQSGALTTTSGIVSTILVIAIPNSLIFFGAVIIHAKLYINTILAVLNSRKYVQKQGMLSFELNTLGLGPDSLHYRRNEASTLASSGFTSSQSHQNSSSSRHQWTSSTS